MVSKLYMNCLQIVMYDVSHVQRFTVKNNIIFLSTISKPEQVSVSGVSGVSGDTTDFWL